MTNSKYNSKISQNQKSNLKEDIDARIYNIYFDLKTYHNIVECIHNSDDESNYLVTEQINQFVTRQINNNERQTLLNWFREPRDIADIEVTRLIQLSEAAREFRGYKFLLTLHTINRANLEDSMGLLHYFMYLVEDGDAVTLDDDIAYKHDYNYFISEVEHM